MAPITGNVIINMANNYCYRFHCHELFEKLKIFIAESNGSKRAIYKLLVEHFGRIICAKKDSFVGELNQQTNYTLLKDINTHLFMQVQIRKKYSGVNDTFVTFFAM